MASDLTLVIRFAMSFLGYEVCDEINGEFA